MRPPRRRRIETGEEPSDNVTCQPPRTSDERAPLEPLGTNISLITENDLCISCGACRPACPFGEVEIAYVAAKGFYEPRIRNEATCHSCADQTCLRVCPSYAEDFTHLAAWTDPEQRIGPHWAIYTGHNRSAELRRRASSGGIIKEVCRYFLDSREADAVITLRHVNGLDYEPQVYERAADLLEGPGSIYHNISFERVFDILSETPGRFVLVALPCQLTAITKWQKECPHAMRGSIVFTVGLICGWMFSRHAVEHFARSQGVDPASLRDVTYRGGDKVGRLVLESAQPSSFSRRPRYWVDRHAVPFRVAFSRTYNSQRCLLCTEHLNYLADISVGDAWLHAFAEEQVGTSIVVARSGPSVGVLEELVRQGRIELEPATEADVIESQSERIALGTEARALCDRIRGRGGFAPYYRVPLPDPLPASRMTAWRNLVWPGLCRLMAQRGWGYVWFRLRCALRHVHLTAYVPVAIARRLLRPVARVVGNTLKTGNRGRGRRRT